MSDATEHYSESWCCHTKSRRGCSLEEVDVDVDSDQWSSNTADEMLATGSDVSIVVREDTETQKPLAEPKAELSQVSRHCTLLVWVCHVVMPHRESVLSNTSRESSSTVEDTLKQPDDSAKSDEKK
jgi:hypothetical protein